VRQISVLRLEESIVSSVAEKYQSREEQSFVGGPLRLEESVDLIIELTTIYSLTTIVIDALDECDRKTRYKLLGALTSIVQRSPGLVKIFVSSRDDRDVVLHLQKSPNLYIKASNNKRDIFRYVQAEIAQAISQKRLLDGTVSPELTQEIIGTLSKQAQGM